MSEMTDLKTETLKGIKQALNDKTRSQWENLCEAACIFLSAAVDVELADREPKKGKGK